MTIKLILKKKKWTGHHTKCNQNIFEQILTFIGCVLLNTETAWQMTAFFLVNTITQLKYGTQTYRSRFKITYYCMLL
jgi:hypothetical protein